jgi:hypothetical protein
MLYAPQATCTSGSTNGSGFLPPDKKIQGRSLANKLPHLRAAHRAILLANIFDGTNKLEDLTVSQLCMIIGVSQPYAHAAVKLTPEQRLEVERNERPLIAPKPPNAVHNEICNMVRLFGVDRVLAAAVEVERSLIQA